MWKIFFNLYYFLKRGNITVQGAETCAIIAAAFYAAIVTVFIFFALVTFNLSYLGDLMINHKYFTLGIYAVMGLISILYGQKRCRYFYHQKMGKF
ncbi:hypothetical protein EV690_2092 [Celerinatantimonas diazotrophica]|uniref:Uncharacterized protein n=1 Tax=Celerinatantimonas diazotrophica TaxID=412034 RepID=A0A4R1JLQ6_9GAMM|nr:hypothetical protein EV690_2092 [Celerinatantimonas diazotrophica]CAG9296305.1 hypothetical protein CEDIAZO_01453 [Celerinatantimonas diazotrophica]